VAVHSQSFRLTEEAILDAALDLVETDGADRLSMRRLAAKLGVTPRAIYRYVPSKSQLLERLTDRLLHGINDDDSGSWQDQLLKSAVATWRVLRNYPGLATYIVQSPLSPQARNRVARVVNLLRQGGFDPETADLAWRSYHTYVYGLIALEAQFGSSRRDISDERAAELGLRAWITGLDVELRPGRIE
jgi:AcrR family transcriptional regulator